jgi:branched-chain amino acid transport system substrate-binding protein
VLKLGVSLRCLVAETRISLYAVIAFDFAINERISRMTFAVIRLTFLTATVMMTSLIFVSHARAEDGVTAKDIRIGIVNDQSGPSDSIANKHFNSGATVYFDKVNKEGGVNGRKISVLMYDDAYEPEKTAEQTKKALETDKVFMLMNFSGTPTVKAVLPIIEKSKVPFLFPKTGDLSPRVPLQKNIFNLRASYQDEIHALIKEVVVKRGLHKVAILMQSDGFGQAMKQSVVSAFQSLGLMEEVRKRGSALVAEGITVRNSMDITEAFNKIAAGDPEVVLLAVPPGQAIPFIKKMEAEKKKWQLIAANNNNAIVDKLEGSGQGILISQVMPLVDTSTLEIVKRFKADMEAAGKKENINGIGFEGYLNAVVAVDGLKRAGTKLTREGLIESLEKGLSDVGGIQVKFSPTQHSGGPAIVISTVKGGKVVE